MNSSLTYDFFVGNASEFLSGPIYDLNQIGQVIAGTYNILFYVFLYLNLFINLIRFILKKPVHDV